VKGTVAGAFTTIDLTAKEMKAAEAWGESYWLYLVANCLSDYRKCAAYRIPRGS
jgi:hypothetical protein